MTTSRARTPSSSTLEGERRQARDVARLLDISRIEEIDEEAQALADSSDETGTLPANVVVSLGSDKRLR